MLPVAAGHAWSFLKLVCSRTSKMEIDEVEFQNSQVQKPAKK